ncbi:hypothetical protein Tsubulata_018175 [Turnera subulata]|uniref:S1 motif domain-containing protein n=1 Tax=Turnera subulata TaxID=218843 RepID=A0A9Q0J5K9_9ROSI|nr:hypothetical protein Tsubulata_018175 [Turnera subulata]
MGRVRRKLNLSPDEDDDDADHNLIVKGKRKMTVLSDDEDDDDEGLDEFEIDGFLVDTDEEEEGFLDGNDKQGQTKKRKRKSSKNFVLDEDDLELLQENRTLGFLQPKSSGNKCFKRLKKAEKDTALAEQSAFVAGDASFSFDGSSGEDKAISDDDDDLADFIVDDGVSYEKVVSRRVEDRKPKNVTVASRSALEAVGYLLGDAAEILRHQGLVKIVNPDDEFDLEHKMINSNVRILEADVPERIQMFEEIAGPATTHGRRREEESLWILRQLATNSYPLFCENNIREGLSGVEVPRKITKDDILRFLELYQLEKYDVPFIAMYRKEKCLSLLEDPEKDGLDNCGFDSKREACLKWHKILWAINELDKKWLLLQKRKTALRSYYDKRYEEESFDFDDMTRVSLIKKNFESIMRSLKAAETNIMVDDVDMKFCLHFPPVQEGVGRKFRGDKRILQHSDGSGASLLELAVKFGCSSEQFGLNLTQENLGMVSWVDTNESPEVIASKFTGESFQSPEAVLEAARHMVALEMSCEPSVRSYVRGIFTDKALVSTNPTPEGDEAIHSFHQFWGIKWLRDKPLDKFQDAQWLLIQKAEEDKLLQVVIELPESALNKLISDSQEIYLTKSGDGFARLWNEQRKLILQEALLKLLLPSLQNETRALLTNRAKNWLLMEYGKQFWNRASVAPYKCKNNICNLEEGLAPRVMACCWGPGKPPTTFVVLDSCGQLLDVMEAGSLFLRSQSVNDQQRKANNQQRVVKFILTYRPDVIIIGAVNVSSTRLKDDIKEIILKMEENNVDAAQVVNQISIVYGDESLPKLYENSSVSMKQLPHQDGIVRRAVALGRCLLNPLAMIATLCGPQKEIVCWKLHALDHFLTSEEKYKMIEMVMVDVTNQVGVEINFGACNDWLLAPLQFVSGLGPQKAAFLQHQLIGGKTVDNRKQLAGFGLLTEKIFCNAVAFLRINGSEIHSFGGEYYTLDDTRIHPESYGLAERLVMAVLNDDVHAHPIQFLKDNLHLLNDFDTNDFADKYETEQGENKRETLQDIKVELIHGFRDPRKPYEELSLDEVFHLVSGENRDAFSEGRIVQAIVRRVLAQRAFCALNCGLTGVLMKDDYLDDVDDCSLTDKLHEGDTLSCKIKQIEKSRYEVFLTCKESELKNLGCQNLREDDPYYCKGQSSSLILKQKSLKEEVEKKHFMSRSIVHPYFKNITRDDAITFLCDKDIGEFIFHPSSRGPHHLTLSLKVCDGLCVHKDIIEGEKDLSNIASLLHIGKTLKIGDNIFKNLDEVIDKYVEPLANHLSAMMNFKKFKRGSKVELDELLRVEKSEYPVRIVYCFGISYEHPGAFILSYIRTNLHHEYIALYPEGFKFRKRIFGKVEQLVAYFQQHIDDRPALRRNDEAGSLVGASMSGGNTSGWQSMQNLSTDERLTVGSEDRNNFVRDNGGEDGWSSGDGGRRGRGRGRGSGRGRGRGHPSGIPRPNGGHGEGQGHHSYNGEQFKGTPEYNIKDKDNEGGRHNADDSSKGGNWHNNSVWKEGNLTVSSDGGNWGNGGRSYNNNATREAASSGSGSGTGSGGNWSSYGGQSGGWSGSNEHGRSSGGGWGSGEGAGGSRGGGSSSYQGDRGRGRGRGRGPDFYNSVSQNVDEEPFSSGWRDGGTDKLDSLNCRSEKISGGWVCSGRGGVNSGTWSNAENKAGGCFGNNEGKRDDWDNSAGFGRGRTGDWGSSRAQEQGRGRGRGRGNWNNYGRGDNNHNGDSGQNTSSWGMDAKDTVGHDEKGVKSWAADSGGSRNWTAHSTNNWDGNSAGGNASRGRGRGRGRGNENSCGRGYNNHNGGDSGQHASWGMDTKDTGGSDDKGVKSWANDGSGSGNWGAPSTNSWGGNNAANVKSWANDGSGSGNWGAPSTSSWGGNDAGGNINSQWGDKKEAKTTNAGADNWGGNRTDSRGILGSGPPGENNWMVGDSTGGWKSASSSGGSGSGGSRGDLNADSETGSKSGWDAAPWKSSTPSGGGGW